MSVAAHNVDRAAVEIRVRGRVQGVGFRPAVWRHARALGLDGDVRNDSGGVLIKASGARAAVAALIDVLKAAPPPLARIDAIEARDIAADWPAGFRIADSAGGAIRTEVAPDARICAACAAEILDPFERRFRYPFANCTDCGPRFSIVSAVPYDRATTTMAPFALCEPCDHEYHAPVERRFHAEAVACHRCGPKARLVRCDGAAFTFDRHSPLDEVDAVGGLLLAGQIVAIKGIGGYQLGCDATNAEAVARLRQRKQRDGKPFALMARDLGVIRRYCTPSDEELRVLQSPEGPIVLLQGGGLPDAVAPGLTMLGFMLPTTPLHVLALKRVDRPVVMTRGSSRVDLQACKLEYSIVSPK